MGYIYDNSEREKLRIAFAKRREKGHSILASCEVAGISPSTYYAWNKGDGWSKASGWDKGDGSNKVVNWDKGDGFSK